MNTSSEGTVFWESVKGLFGAALSKPEWWSAGANVASACVAFLAFRAAWRASRTAAKAFSAQSKQLKESEEQTYQMHEQVREMSEQRNDGKAYALSIWLRGADGDDRADIVYVNSSRHPVYNIKLEITERSDRYLRIPSLDPTETPVLLEKANEFFADELRMVGGIRRPGVALEFNTFDGERYGRDHTGDLISFGGSALDGEKKRPHRMWLPEGMR